MKRRIRLLVLLMAACTLALAGLQAYWNYQAYAQATRTFGRDANEALAEAARQETELHQQALLRRYRTWLADTSAIRIRSYINPTSGNTYFLLADRQQFAHEHRQPFQLGFQGYHKPPGSPDSTGRAFFIRRFLAGPHTRDQRECFTYFYTRRLGEKLAAASQADSIHTRRLARLYAQVLRQREVTSDFQLDFKRPKRPPVQAAFATDTVALSLPGKLSQPVRAWFAAPNQVYLHRMKWVLLGSLGLIGVVVGCFAYTLRALLTQERLAELKNDFVNNMTHELKTPVATIGITAEALASFELAPADRAEYLGIIRQQASRLGGLIDKILQSVVAEQSSLALARRPLDLAVVLAQTVAQAQPRLAETGSHLQYDAPPAPVPISGDALHLTNVLTTLLDNALKYGRPGGVITLWCRALPGAATICLTNEGPPIAPQYQARIFEKFFRVPTGNRHDVPGYGLGLHYARTLVERHGGTIAVHSHRVHTTFTISLPLAHAPAPFTAAGR